MFQTFNIATRPEDGPPRLKALRAAMTSAGVDGFIVPRTDMYRGENVAPCDERLAWLTGFTGSAGLAIITHETAAVFVDGRYTLQARDQLALDHFEIKNIPADAPAKLAAELLSEGQVLGFDPWLMVRTEHERFAKTCRAAGITLAPCANLIDAIWQDRPSAPLGLAKPHDDALAGEAHGTKRAALAKTIAQSDCTAALLTMPEALAWLLNIRGTDIARMPVVHALGILQADTTVDLFIAPQKLDDTLRAHLGAAVRLHDFDAYLPEVAALKGQIWIDPDTAPKAVLDAVTAKPLFKRDPCVLPRAQKNAVEIAGAHAAHRTDGAAMVEFLSWFDAEAPSGKLTEIDVAQNLERFRRATNELRDISFETISGSGPNGAIVHYRVNEATNRTLEPNSLMLVDSGGQYASGTTDITRTMSVGTPPGGAREAFTRVLKGMIALSLVRWPQGLAGRDIDALARAPLWAAGFDYDHGTGHGVGSYLGVHEGPANLSRRSHEPLLPGMILSNEPGYYREGAFGIRIENLMVVRPPQDIEGGDRPMLGFETLTYTPIDRRLIDVDLLTATELDWLNAYHAEVAKRYKGAVSQSAQGWLAAATTAI